MTTETRALVAQDDGAVLERVVIAGDLAKLSPQDRVRYYQAVCQSLGLNPLTKPFDYIVLNGRLTLYAGKTATDQLRTLKGISIDGAERDTSDPDYATWLVTGHDASGRTDMEIGSVSIKGATGEARANAIMKALTKGKRRLTLSLAGLGWLDETEVGSVPSAEAVDVDPDTGEIRRTPTLRESIRDRRAAIAGDHIRVEEPIGRAAAPQGEASSEDVSPDPAGGLDASADQAIPTPAPAPRCAGFHEEHGRCRKGTGHTGPHRTEDASWPVTGGG